jgi:F-type H+-transporting ATPase subunit b
VDLLAIASIAGHASTVVSAAEGPLFQINLFQVVIAAANFVVFLVLMWRFAFTPVAAMLAERRARIERGWPTPSRPRRIVRARRRSALTTLAEARRESNEILARAQKVAQETRDADIAATREELERMRVRATDEIEAEKGRALAELRSEVADLALAGGRPRRRRDHERPAPAPPRRGVPRRPAAGSKS